MALPPNGFQVFPAIWNIVERCGTQWTGVEAEFRFKFIHSSRFKAKNSEKCDYSAKNLKSRQSEKFCEKICNTEGVSQLKDGAMQLSDGLIKFNEEGIQKIIDLVNGDLDDLAARLRATIEASRKYHNFSGINDNMDGQVKFVYRTDEIN